MGAPLTVAVVQRPPVLLDREATVKSAVTYLHEAADAGARLVVLKMLPFDNKSEFQVVANLPVGTTVETTARVLEELSHVIERVPEVSDYEAYAGTSAFLSRQFFCQRQLKDS